MFEAAFAEIRHYTDQLGYGRFIDNDKVSYCQNLNLFTFDPHTKECCCPILLHYPYHYTPMVSGYFPPPNFSYVNFYFHFHYQGYWRRYQTI